MQDWNAHAHALEQFRRDDGRKELCSTQVDNGHIQERPVAGDIRLRDRVNKHDVIQLETLSGLAQSLFAGAVTKEDKCEILPAQAIGGAQ